MAHVIMWATLLSNNDKRSQIQRHDMILYNLAWWLKDQSFYSTRSWDFWNPSFARMINNSIYTITLESSCLTQRLGDKSCWIR
jgi:predicted NAD/FAD-binding protein